MDLSLSHKVIWHEGMLLMPQHFQQQDRYIKRLINQFNSALCPHTYGIIHLEFDEILLERGELAIKYCQALLPDGTYIDIPSKDKAPIPVKLDHSSDKKLFFLGIPKAKEQGYESKDETISNHETRYSIEEISIRDSHASLSYASTPALLKVGRLNLLLLEEGHSKNYCSIPLTQINYISNHQYVLEETYIPPLLNIYASKLIQKSLHKLENFLRISIKTISEKILSKKLSISDENLEIQLLALLNRLEAMISFYNIHKHPLKPKNLYFELFIFAKELAAFKNPQHYIEIKADYDNQSLAHTFQTLFETIYSLLKNNINHSATVLFSEKVNEHLWSIVIPKTCLENEYYFILAIQAPDITAEKSVNITHNIKTAPMAEINNLIYRSLPGIDLYALDNIPKEITYQPNTLYFRFNQNHDLWLALKQEPLLAIYLDENFYHTKIEILAINKKQN